MGLLPLEFSACMLDSPYFRENLKAHEKQLDQTSTDIKTIIKDIQDVVDSAKILSKAKRTLAQSLANFQFDCLGTSLTDDEVVISNSLREFSKFLSLVEDETDRMLEHAHEKYIQPLVTFRKDQIGSVRKTKKDFDKQTARFCAAQDRYVNLGSKKEESLAEAAESVRYEKRNLTSSSLEYVYLMHVVQERKKFDFVEALLSFIHTWSNYYKHGNSITEKSASYTDDLKARVRKTRENYSATIEQYESLKQKMLTGHLDPGLLNRMYTRQGYLYVLNKKNIIGASQWSKHYCQYQSNSRTLTMIPYTQLNGKITTTETINVSSCICKEDSTEKFRFVVSGEELSNPGVVIMHTIQAMSEYERKHWVEAMGGTWPAINTLQRIRADSVEENLNSLAFTFLKDCLTELEDRGLNDQGLYRVGGVVSKVKKLLNLGLDPRPGDTPLSLNDPKQWESKTIASAIKQYFRDLSKPLMTHHLYTHFVEAIKHESETERLHELQLVILKLPIASREILKVLIRHLHKVAARSDTNLMTASNLGVCFGPTLLRPREETVASIMDIKFCNEVVQNLIENCDRFFSIAGSSPNPTPQNHYHKKNSDEQLQHTNHHQYRKATPKREQRGSSTPKRTQSFSSFSQLSTNSLPDIKEFKDRALAALSGVRHQGGDKSSRTVSQQHAYSTILASPSTVKHAILSKLPSPTKVLSRSPSTQDDLMASLEMMNSLAADLPTSSPLKRSHTIQARRGYKQQQEHQIQGLVTGAATTTATSKKPPLPKSSAPSSTATTPTSIPASPPAFAVHQVSQGQQCNNHPVPNTVPSHQISSAVQTNYDNLRHHHHHHHHHNQNSYHHNNNQRENGDTSSTCSSSNGSTSNGVNNSTMGAGKGYRPPPPVPPYTRTITQLSRNNSVPSIPTLSYISNENVSSFQMPKLSYDETINHRNINKNKSINKDKLPENRSVNYADAHLTPSPRPGRPTELFIKQISLSEVQTVDTTEMQRSNNCGVERIRLESSESSSPTTIRSNFIKTLKKELKDPPPPPPISSFRKEQEDCETPPPIPTRRYRRIYVNPPSSSILQGNYVTQTRNISGNDQRIIVDTDMEHQKEHQPNSPSSLETRRRFPQGYASSSSNTTDSSPGMIRSNMSMDSGVVVASPSPPTADSGIAISPPILVRKGTRDTLTSIESKTNSKNVSEEVEIRKKVSDVEQTKKSLQDNSIKNVVTSTTSEMLRNATNGKSGIIGEDTISVSSNSALSAAGADSDTSGSRYDNVSERKRLSSDSLSKTSTLVAAAAAIAAANHTNSSTEGNVSHQKFDHDVEDEEGGNEAEDEASDFDASYDGEENCDNGKCCGNDEDNSFSDVSDESNSSSDDLELEGSDESDCESNCSELMRIRKHKKQRDEKSSKTNSTSEHDDDDEKGTTMNLDDFSSPASLTETRPELVAQIDQEIEISDHYKAVSKRDKTSISNSATSTQFRKSGPYENYIPPPLNYVETEGDGHHSKEIGTMTSSVSPKGASKPSHGKQSIKKETSTISNIAGRKGGDETTSSKKQWEQHGIESNQQASAKNSDAVGIVDAATDRVNAPPLSLHAQGLSSIRRLLAAGQTSNV